MWILRVCYRYYCQTVYLLEFLETNRKQARGYDADDYSTRGGSPAGLGINWSMVRGNPDEPQFCTLTDSRRYEARFHTQTRTRSAKIGGEVGFDSRVSEAIGRVAEQVRGARSQERLGCPIGYSTQKPPEKRHWCCICTGVADWATTT